MAAVNRHVEPAEGVTEVRVHGVGGTSPDVLLEQTGTWQVAGDDTAGFYRGLRPEEGRTVEAYSWGGLTAKSRSRAFWVLLLPFSLINLAGWMVEPGPPEDGEPGSMPSDPVQRDFWTKVHETIVQLIAIATTAMYVMWAALISVNTIAFQCGAIVGCQEDRWYVDFLGAGFFVDHPGRRVIAGLVVPLALLAFFWFLGRRSKRHYDDYGLQMAGVSADTVDETRTAIGRASFWFPGQWQTWTARLHVAVALLILGGLLGRSVGRFEELFGVEVANEQLGTWIYVGSFAIALAGAVALFVATMRSRPLLGHGVQWFSRVTSTILGLSVVLFVVSVWLTYRLDAPNEALAPRSGGVPFEPITDFWGFGWAPIILLGLGIIAVGAFSLVQLWRWIQWHFIHFDQIIPPVMLLMIVLWQWAYWVAAVVAVVAVVGDQGERRMRSAVAAENGDRTKKTWRVVVFGGFLAATVLVRFLSTDLAHPFGLDWPRVTPVAFFTLTLVGLSIAQVRGHLNDAGRSPRPWSVLLALLGVPAGIVALGWALALTLNREEWVYGALGLAWCVAAVVWLAQFEHARWRWNGPGAVALLGLTMVMGGFSGLMIWLVDVLDRDGSEFVIKATGIYQWLTVVFAVTLGVVVVGQAAWYLFARMGLGTPPEEGRPEPKEVLPIALRATDVVLTVAVMVMLTAMAALILHLTDTYTNHLDWIDDRPPDTWDGIVQFTSWLALGVVLGTLLAVRNGLKDRGFRTRFGIVWDVATFWPRSFHPFAPPPYTARAVPEIQSRLKEAVDPPNNVDGSAKRPAGTVILSGHSQGSVVSLAVLATLPGRVRERVWLVTHGSPLSKLYQRFFPMYFPVEVFNYGASVDGLSRVESGRWLNFWRRTDPIGGPCFAGFDDPPKDATPPPPWSRVAVDLSGSDVKDLPDVALDDPLPAPTPYSPDPDVRGHSGYMADPAMRRALEVLASELVRRERSSVSR